MLKLIQHTKRWVLLDCAWHLLRKVGFLYTCVTVYTENLFIKTLCVTVYTASVIINKVCVTVDTKNKPFINTFASQLLDFEEK